MPELGEIKRGNEVGYRSTAKHIYTACVVCGKRRWVAMRAKKARYDVCFYCRMMQRKTGKVCMFCHQPVWRGRKVALHSAYGLVRAGTAHIRCFKRFLNAVELGKVHLGGVRSWGTEQF